jgi:hypothetical protein
MPAVIHMPPTARLIDALDLATKLAGRPLSADELTNFKPRRRQQQCQPGNPRRPHHQKPQRPRPVSRRKVRH